VVALLIRRPVLGIAAYFGIVGGIVAVTVSTRCVLAWFGSCLRPSSLSCWVCKAFLEMIVLLVEVVMLSR